jgi:hypothetical protein
MGSRGGGGGVSGEAPRRLENCAGEVVVRWRLGEGGNGKWESEGGRGLACKTSAGKRRRRRRAERPACSVKQFFFFTFHTIQRKTLTTHYTHPYEYMYANPTPMSTSEGLSTGRSGDSRSHHWRLVVDGNAAYHLTHNAGKSWNKSRKMCEHQDLNSGG